MTAWTHVIKIGDIVMSEDERPFTETRDGIVQRILDSTAVQEDSDEAVTLTLLADELEHADDEDEFNTIMGEIYDLGDRGKWLWIGP